MDILNSVIDGITSTIKGPKDVAIMVILLVIIILSYVLNYYKPEIKGYLGEKRVFKLLSKLPEDKYSILHNIMLKTKKGTTQIDYVVVSCYGLFIIEVKFNCGNKSLISGCSLANLICSIKNILLILLLTFIT